MTIHEKNEIIAERVVDFLLDTIEEAYGSYAELNGTEKNNLRFLTKLHLIDDIVIKNVNIDEK